MMVLTLKKADAKEVIVEKREEEFQNKKQSFGYCPRCFYQGLMEKHHILPSQYFKGDNQGHKIYLCSNCHKLLHTILNKLSKLSKEEYKTISQAFIHKKSYDILKFTRTR